MEDLFILVCHVICKDHVIKVLCDFIARNLSHQVIILSRLVAIDTVIVQMRWFYFVA